MPARRIARSIGGFTLVEAMIAIAVLAILASLAAPSFKELLAAQRIRLTASDLYSSLLMARSEAMKRNVTVTVTATGGDWQNGWTVTYSSPTITLQTHSAPANVTVTGDVTPLSYAYTGRPLAGVGATFKIYESGATAAARCLSLSLSGMPQLKVDTDGDPSNGC